MTSLAHILRRVHSTHVLAAALALAGCTGTTGPRPTTPTGVPLPQLPQGPWTLAWSDEFDAAAGTTFDPTKWVADTGGQGWGNQQREYNTDRPENVSHNGAGQLVITAKVEPVSTTYRCWYGTCQYTSARILTKGKFAQTFGKFEARIRVPRGQGIWPAFWMLGNNIDAVGWPQSGEIDIMENIGKEPSTVHGTVHGPGYSGGSGIGGSYTLASGAFADDYHIFAIEWTASDIRWFVDGQQYRSLTGSNLPAGATWVFDHPYFILLNVAVGGAWPGNPDATSTFPQQMLVDYVRVYTR